MAEDNNKKDARERNKNAKSILKVTEVKTEDGAEYSTGAATFTAFFNSLVDEVKIKAQKEVDKPRYRFLEDRNVFVAGSKLSEEERNAIQENSEEENSHIQIVMKELGRSIIINKKTLKSVYFDEDLKIISEKEESLGDIVKLRFDKKKNPYKYIKINNGKYEIEEPTGDEENPFEHIGDVKNGTWTMENYDDIEFVPVRKNEFTNVCTEIDKLEKKLQKYKYRVKVCEKLECTNVTEESRYYIRISKDNGIYVDIDLLKYEEDIKDFTFNEQDFIENKICRIEGSNSKTTKNIAKHVTDYLAHVIYFREFYTLIYNKIGWDYYDWDRAGWIFKYDKIYSNVGLLRGEARDNCAEGLECKKEILDLIQRVGEESDAHLNKIYWPTVEWENTEEELSQEKKTALINERYGEEFEWVSFTRKLINTHPYDALILGAGISGLIRQLLPYTKENNININIVGAPASGKSTICHYLLGIFGKPEKLEGSFTDTANSMEQIRIKRPILPYVLDERMLRIEGESEKAKAHTILMDIFREYEGKVKERLGKQYEETAGERTYGPIISSSVKSMMDYVFETDDLGQYRRFMEFDVGTAKSATLFKDDKELPVYFK